MFKITKLRSVAKRYADAFLLFVKLIFMFYFSCILFFGWEGVGLASYLLIGFWYDRKAAADACQKAFVTNRVGDFGLLLGILGLYWATNSLIAI